MSNKKDEDKKVEEKEIETDVSSPKIKPEEEEDGKSPITVKIGDAKLTVPLIKHGIAKKLLKLSRDAIKHTRDVQKLRMKLERAITAIEGVEADSEEEKKLEERIEKLQDSVMEYGDKLNENKIDQLKTVFPELKDDQIDDFPEIFINEVIATINILVGVRVSSKNV